MISKVNWGAILAGCLIGLATMFFFSLFAFASGIFAANVIEPWNLNISLPAAMFIVVTAIASFTLAGYCTVRLAGLRNPGIACLHALSGFALAGVIVPALFTRTFLSGVPGFAIAPPPSPFLSPSLAWTNFFAYGLACIAACVGGMWATAHRAPVAGTYKTEIENAEREERWPAA